MNHPDQYPENVSALPSAEMAGQLRIVEALLFASNQPLSLALIKDHLPKDANAKELLKELQALYGPRGVNLVELADGWAFRTADDLAYLFTSETNQKKKLSNAALETLAIIAYHQPVTRSEIEQVRGVGISKGTLDVLMETGWVKMCGRRRAPGRPVTYGTTEDFLTQFDLAKIGDLPGLRELKGAGLLSAQLPDDFQIPDPGLLAELQDDELPLDYEDEDEDEREDSLSSAEVNDGNLDQ